MSTVITKIVCMIIISAPVIVERTSGITVTPLVELGMSLAAFAAGLVMSELYPTFRTTDKVAG